MFWPYTGRTIDPTMVTSVPGSVPTFGIIGGVPQMEHSSVTSSLGACRKKGDSQVAGLAGKGHRAISR